MEALSKFIGTRIWPSANSTLEGNRVFFSIFKMIKEGEEKIYFLLYLEQQLEMALPIFKKRKKKFGKLHKVIQGDSLPWKKLKPIEKAKSLWTSHSSLSPIPTPAPLWLLSYWWIFIQSVFSAFIYISVYSEKIMAYSFVFPKLITYFSILSGDLGGRRGRLDGAV